jgi:DNA-binding CsgD family transcriptional regulator
MLARESVPAPATALRIYVAASEPGRREHLRALLRDEGHVAVESALDAEAVLSDDEGFHATGVPVVSLSGVDSDHAGVLDPEATPAQIDAALRAVTAGLVVRSTDIAPRGFTALDEGHPDAPLTPRELEVLKCIGEGLTNKLIARRLDISLHTVKFHIESLLRKLGATTRAQALARALERGQRRTMEF